VTDETAPATPRIFGGPTAVRRADGQRFLWGDERSGQVADVIYGRGERISAVTFDLGPGHWFGTSETWKPLYDQHRFYYVVHGTLAIHDPETGDVAVAQAGEAVTWRGARYHFGYNVGDDDVLVLDWFAPRERLLDVPESSLATSKRDLREVLGGRYDLLGAWPDRLQDDRQTSFAEGGIVTVRERDALHLVEGTRPPRLVSILSSGEQLTAGTFTVRGATKTEPEQHPGDEVVYALSGQLHVHLPERGDWLELDPLDCAFIPEGTVHEYWSYRGAASRAVFCVAPGYR
jgi:quercetin dioxygenase-like cupin family protein